MLSAIPRQQALLARAAPALVRLMPLASRHVRGLHVAIRNPCAERRPVHPRNQQVRNIVIGRDGAHWNTIVNMVPQAEEWMIERFGKVRESTRVALP